METKADQWDARLYDNAHAFVNQMAGGVIELLAPKPGEHILDLGCGTGPLAKQIADTGATVIGVDASPAMIDQAKQNYPAIDFQVMDATTMQFDRPFDAIFSNAALHWVKPPEAAAARMFAALTPGGRLVLEMGGKGNVSKILSAAIQAGESIGIDLRGVVDINYFPTLGEYAGVLEHAGFSVEFAVLFDRPTPLNEAEAGLRNWLRMFRPGVEGRILPSLREDFYALVEKLCRDSLLIEGVWNADYRRLRVKAVRPATCR